MVLSRWLSSGLSIFDEKRRFVVATSFGTFNKKLKTVFHLFVSFVAVVVVVVFTILIGSELG